MNGRVVASQPNVSLSNSSLPALASHERKMSGSGSVRISPSDSALFVAPAARASAAPTPAPSKSKSVLRFFSNAVSGKSSQSSSKSSREAERNVVAQLIASLDSVGQPKDKKASSSANDKYTAYLTYGDEARYVSKVTVDSQTKLNASAKPAVQVKQLNYDLDEALNELVELLESEFVLMTEAMTESSRSTAKAATRPAAPPPLPGGASSRAGDADVLQPSRKILVSKAKHAGVAEGGSVSKASSLKVIAAEDAPGVKRVDVPAKKSSKDKQVDGESTKSSKSKSASRDITPDPSSESLKTGDEATVKQPKAKKSLDGETKKSKKSAEGGEADAVKKSSKSKKSADDEPANAEPKKSSKSKADADAEPKKSSKSKDTMVAAGLDAPISVTSTTAAAKEPSADKQPKTPSADKLPKTPSAESAPMQAAVAPSAIRPVMPAPASASREVGTGSISKGSVLNRLAAFQEPASAPSRPGPQVPASTLNAGMRRTSLVSATPASPADSPPLVPPSSSSKTPSVHKPLAPIAVGRPPAPVQPVSKPATPPLTPPLTPSSATTPPPLQQSGSFKPAVPAPTSVVAPTLKGTTPRSAVPQVGLKVPAKVGVMAQPAPASAPLSGSSSVRLRRSDLPTEAAAWQPAQADVLDLKPSVVFRQLRTTDEAEDALTQFSESIHKTLSQFWRAATEGRTSDCVETSRAYQAAVVELLCFLNDVLAGKSMHGKVRSDLQPQFHHLREKFKALKLLDASFVTGPLSSSGVLDGAKVQSFVSPAINTLETTVDDIIIYLSDHIAQAMELSTPQGSMHSRWLKNFVDHKTAIIEVFKSLILSVKLPSAKSDCEDHARAIMWRSRQLASFVEHVINQLSQPVVRHKLRANVEAMKNESLKLCDAAAHFSKDPSKLSDIQSHGTALVSALSTLAATFEDSTQMN